MRHTLILSVIIGGAALLVGSLGCDSEETRRGNPLPGATTTSSSTSSQGGSGAGMQQGGGGAGTGGMQQGGNGAGGMTSNGECITTFCDVLLKDSACESCIQNNCSVRLNECLNDTGAGEQNCDFCSVAWATGDSDGLCSVSGDRYQLLYECACGHPQIPSSHGFCG